MTPPLAAQHIKFIIYLLFNPQTSVSPLTVAVPLYLCTAAFVSHRPNSHLHLVYDIQPNYLSRPALALLYPQFK